jgi:hypothetical protein
MQMQVLKRLWVCPRKMGIKTDQKFVEKNQNVTFVAKNCPKNMKEVTKSCQ